MLHSRVSKFSPHQKLGRDIYPTILLILRTPRYPASSGYLSGSNKANNTNRLIAAQLLNVHAENRMNRKRNSSPTVMSSFIIGYWSLDKLVFLIFDVVQVRPPGVKKDTPKRGYLQLTRSVGLDFVNLS